jgi:hypothetical protein
MQRPSAKTHTDLVLSKVIRVCLEDHAVAAVWQLTPKLQQIRSRSRVKTTLNPDSNGLRAGRKGERHWRLQALPFGLIAPADKLHHLVVGLFGVAQHIDARGICPRTSFHLRLCSQL